MHGVAPLERAGARVAQGLYGPEANEATYERLRSIARDILDAGRIAIVDAAFLRRSQRESFRALAAELGVPFVILAFEAKEATLRRARCATAGRRQRRVGRRPCGARAPDRDPRAADGGRERVRRHLRRRGAHRMQPARRPRGRSLPAGSPSDRICVDRLRRGSAPELTRVNIWPCRARYDSDAVPAVSNRRARSPSASISVRAALIARPHMTMYRSSLPGSFGRLAALCAIVALGWMTAGIVGRRDGRAERRQRDLPRVPWRQGRETRRRQADRGGGGHVRPIGARRNASRLHGLPRRRLPQEAAASGQARARRLRPLPRQGGQGLQRHRPWHCAQGRQRLSRRRAPIVTAPHDIKRAKDPGIAHQSREPRGDMRQMSRKRCDGREGEAARRQHRQPVPRQHSWQGADGRGSGVRPDLHELPWRAYDPRQIRSRERNESGAHSGYLRQLPQEGEGAVRDRASTGNCGTKAIWPRRAATTATAPIGSSSTNSRRSGLRSSTSAAIVMRITCRPIATRSTARSPRWASRPLRRARPVTARTKYCPSRIRRRRCLRKTGSRPVRNVTPAPRRTSPTTTRMPIGTIAPGTRCTTMRRCSWSGC